MITQWKTAAARDDGDGYKDILWDGERGRGHGQGTGMGIAPRVLTRLGIERGTLSELAKFMFTYPAIHFASL